MIIVITEIKAICAGRCFRSVDFALDCHPKFIPIDKEANHQVVHAFRLGKTDRPMYQSLNPRVQVDVFALDLRSIYSSL
jgi:hypothetical protein